MYVITLFRTVLPAHLSKISAYVLPKGIFSTSEIAVAIYGISSPGSTLFHAMNTLALCTTWRFNHRQEVHSIRSDVVICEKHFEIERLGNGLTSAFKWLGLKPARRSLSNGKICAGSLNFGPRFSPQQVVCCCIDYCCVEDRLACSNQSVA